MGKEIGICSKDIWNFQKKNKGVENSQIKMFNLKS